jgi:hypothetical protein
LEGKVIAPYDPNKSRKDSIQENQTQRALAYSMFNRNLSQEASATTVCKILYDGATSRGTIQKWHTHFNRDNFETADFPHAKNKILNGTLTDFTKLALVVYEHGKRLTAKKTCTRINDLFGKDTVTLEFVQV